MLRSKSEQEGVQAVLSKEKKKGGGLRGVEGGMGEDLEVGVVSLSTSWMCMEVEQERRNIPEPTTLAPKSKMENKFATKDCNRAGRASRHATRDQESKH
jgi:hypothetical protein